MSIGVLFLALLNASIELFFVYSLLWLLALGDITSPLNVTPEWRWRLRWVVGIGVVGFGYIIIRESLRVLGIAIQIPLPGF